MTDLLLAASADPALHGALPANGTAEAVVFWILAPIALGAAIAMVVARNAVHAALLLVLNFFCLAVFYALNQAPFLAAVQVIVYTGAIMILFLFVLMLVGVDAGDSLVETLRGQRVAALLFGLGFIVLVGATIGDAVVDTPQAGLGEAGFIGNVEGIGALVFSRYVFAFELTSALLITAALGAMVLAHRERRTRPGQQEMSRQRFAGDHPTPLPGPGVYAHGDAIDRPALLPDGSTSSLSVAPSLAAAHRGEPVGAPQSLPGTAENPVRPDARRGGRGGPGSHGDDEQHGQGAQHGEDGG